MFSQRYAKDRPARVRLALRLPKAFQRWATAEPALTGKAKPKTAPSNAGNWRPDLPRFAATKSGYQWLSDVPAVDRCPKWMEWAGTGPPAGTQLQRIDGLVALDHFQSRISLPFRASASLVDE